MRKSLGCPLEREQAGYSVEQIFQGGQMYYRDETKQFWVFSADAGTVREHEDVFLSDPEPTEDAPPGFIKPVRGFGRLWQKYPAIRGALGWGITPEVGFTGVFERFEGGTMLYAPAVNGHGKRIYVLYNNGTYRIFADTYAGP